MRLIFTALIICVFSLSLNAQSIEIRTKHGVNVTNTSYSVSGPSSATSIHAYLVLENVSSKPIVIRAMRREVSIVNGMDNSMCFGFTCNSWASGSNPVATFPSDSLTLQPGDSSHTSYLETYPKGLQGCETYKVVYWVSSNSADSSTVLINSCTWATGITELKENKNTVIAAPNPASDMVQIGYNVVDAKNSAEIRVYNVIGEVEKRVTLTDRNGWVHLSAQDLKGGMHFYSLVVDGEIKSTKKLIITH